MQNLFFPLDGEDGLVLFCLDMYVRSGGRGSLAGGFVGGGGGLDDQSQGFTVERFAADHSACGIAFSGLALPAVLICQPRPAKRCVSVEGQGPAERLLRIRCLISYIYTRS